MRLTTTSNNIEYFLEKGISAKEVNLKELLPQKKRNRAVNLEEFILQKKRKQNQITLSSFVLYRGRRVYLEDIFRDYHNVTKKLKKYPRLILCNTRPVIERIPFTVWFPSIIVSNGREGFLYQFDSDTDVQKAEDLMEIKNFYIL